MKDCMYGKGLQSGTVKTLWCYSLHMVSSLLRYCVEGRGLTIPRRTYYPQLQHVLKLSPGCFEFPQRETSSALAKVGAPVVLMWSWTKCSTGKLEAKEEKGTPLAGVKQQGRRTKMCNCWNSSKIRRIKAILGFEIEVLPSTKSLFPESTIRLKWMTKSTPKGWAKSHPQLRKSIGTVSWERERSSKKIHSLQMAMKDPFTAWSFWWGDGVVPYWGYEWESVSTKK